MPVRRCGARRRGMEVREHGRGIEAVLGRARAGRPKLVIAGKSVLDPDSADLHEKLRRMQAHADVALVQSGPARIGAIGLTTVVALPDLRPKVVSSAVFYVAAPLVAVVLAAGRHPAAVVCRSPYEGVIATVAVRLLPRPVRPAVVVEVHGDWRTASRSYGSRLRAIFSGVADRLAVGSILRADRVRVIGAYTESLVRATGYRGPVDAFPTFRDFTPFLETPMANTGDRLVAFLGGSASVKGLDVLLRAWPTVASSVPGARLEVAGPGVAPDREDDLGVVPRGTLDVDAVRDLLDRASIVVMPSRSEGMGGWPSRLTDARVRWWRAPSAGSPRSSRTVRPGCSCRPTIRSRWPTRSSRCSRTRSVPVPWAGWAGSACKLGRPPMSSNVASSGWRLGCRDDHVLFVTQVIDADDPTLGFVASWIDALAERADGVTAIGNEVRGTPALAANVRVVSLGKERGVGRVARGIALQRAVATSGGHRPVLLAHMCPIYLDITSPVTAWRRMPTMLWFAHPSVTPELRLAERLSDVVLTSLPGAYPRPGPKVRVVGQATDTERIVFDPRAERDPGPLRLVAIGRTSPSKGFDRAIRALAKARAEGVEATLRIVGPSTTEEERAHGAELRGLATATGLGSNVTFEPGVTPKQVDGVIRSADVLVNSMVAGSGDKVVFEAMAAAPSAGCQSGIPAVAVRPADRPRLRPGRRSHAGRPHRDAVIGRSRRDGPHPAHPP